MFPIHAEYTVIFDNEAANQPVRFTTYADTLYFIKMLSPDGQHLVAQAILENTANIGLGFTEFRKKLEEMNIDAPLDKRLEELLDSRTKNRIVALSESIRKLFKGQFNNQNFIKVLPQIKKTGFIKLSHNGAYLDLEKFCTNEDSKTFEKVNWQHLTEKLTGMSTLN